jgi:Porin PorA
MRRIIGLTLAGVGAFLIVVAILLRTYLPGQVIKYPLNEYLKTQLRGTNVQYFSPSKIHEISGASMLVTSTVKGDAAAGSSSTAVWNGFTYLYDTTNSLPFEYSSRRFAFDRRTAVLVNCCGANVGGNRSIKQTGLVGFLWPFGTQQITYQVFDPAINKPEPARFAGTSTIDGIPVNRYVEHVTHVQDGTVTLPGSLVGMSGTASVTLPEYYTATNTFWVDPETGAQLNTTQVQRLTLEDSTGATRLVILNGTLNFTPQSLHTVVGLDNTARSEVALIEVILPLVCGVLGLILLVAGIVLAQVRRGDQSDAAVDTIPQPAAQGPAA